MKSRGTLKLLTLLLLIVINTHLLNGETTEVDIQPDGEIETRKAKKFGKSGPLSDEERAEFKKQINQPKRPKDKMRMERESKEEKKKKKKKSKDKESEVETESKEEKKKQKKKKKAKGDQGRMPSKEEREEMRRHATIQEPDLSARGRQGAAPYRQPKEDPMKNRYFEGSSGEDCYEDRGQVYCAPKIFGACCVNSGTTALAGYLNSHQNLTFGTTKEHHFFRIQYRPDRTLAGHYRDEMPQVNRENLEVALMDYKEDWHIKSVKNASVILTPDNYDQVMPDNTMKQASTSTVSSYIRQFPVESHETVKAFDFDPTYLWGFSGPFSLELIKDAIGADNLKFLAVFRNPAHQVCAKMDGRDASWVSKCLSSLDRVLTEPEEYDLVWLHQQEVCPPFIFLNMEHYCYSHMVTRWFEVLPREHFHFVKTEDLRELESRVQTLRDIANFLKVDSSLFDENTITEDFRPRSKSRLSKSKKYHDCIDMFTSSTSFMTKCIQELADILGDDKWLWWS